MTSQITSRIEYLIPTDNRPELLLAFEFDCKNIALLAGFQDVLITI